MTIALVCTTIGDGHFLEDYTLKAEQEGLREEVVFYAIPDMKTPKVFYDRCVRLRDLGFKVEFPLIHQQEEYLKKLGFNHLMPYNTDNRRNLGYIMAYQRGCDVVISIDDDNICTSDSFFKEHALVGKNMQLETRYANWYNVCQDIGLPMVYPRGFPYNKRASGLGILSWQHSKLGGYVAANIGLWVGDPDLDSITWLVNPTKGGSFDGPSFFLGPNTWTPINSQNTAIVKQAVFAYYFIPMGNTVNGLVIDRYGDILQGYFLEKCINWLGHRIRVGSPIVNHVRNSHNYMVDASKEMACIQLMDELLDWLIEAKLEGRTYMEVYECLASELHDQCEKFTGKLWTVDAKAFMHRTAYCMGEWLRVIDSVQ